MEKQNCWEFKKCGREPNGINISELGVCPASIKDCVNKVNSGKNGGRCCWVIAGTFCDKSIQGIYAQKLTKCMDCDFYKKVFEEEGVNRLSSIKILSLIKE